MSSTSGRPVQKPPVHESTYKLRNRGPWTTVEYGPWPDFSIGHTTAFGDGAGVQFNEGSLTELFASFFPLERYYMAQQVHGARVATVSGPARSFLGTDGLMSADSGSLLFIRTADCMPVYVRSSEGRSDQVNYGVVHAGWRGLLDGIVPEALSEHFDGPVKLLVGPHVEVGRYEVGDEVLKEIGRSFDFNRDEMVDHDLVTPDNHADLFEILRYQLGESDVDVQTMHRSPLSTQDESPVRLLSYRRNQTQKRMLNWIYQRPGGAVEQ